MEGLKISYKIIGCSKCGTIFYILKDQKTRVCSKCGYHINCAKTKVLSKAADVNEAQAIVKTLKTPSDVALKLNEFTKNILINQTIKNDKNAIIGNLISELLTMFPNQMPEKILFEKALELDIEEQFLSSILDKFQEAGYLLRNTDKLGNKILKFLNIPFTLGKITISKPKLMN